MKLSAIKTLKSQRLVSAAVKYMLWQRLSTMASTFPRLARAELNAHKSASAQKVVQAFETTRSEFWELFQYAESVGTSYDIPEELDRMTTTPRKPTPNDQIEKLAEATGLPAGTIKANMEANRAKALGVAMETRTALEAAVFEGEFKALDDEENQCDPDCPADQLDAQAEKLVLWLATWAKPDWAELILIKADRARLAKLSGIEDAEKDGATYYPCDDGSEAASRGQTRAMEAAMLKAEREFSH